MKNRMIPIGLIILIAAIIISIYSNYYSISSDVIFNDLNTPNQIDDRFSNTNEMHWTHMPLTYNWNDECNQWLQGRYTPKIELALQEISNVTDYSVTFMKTSSEEPDIMFVCNSSLYYVKISGYTQTLAEAETYYYAETNTFTNSKINIYDPNECKNRPATLIHEILHLFGVEHAPDLQENLHDIMLSVKYDCNAYISNKTVDYLKNIYNK